jgi:hypothetical protein
MCEVLRPVHAKNKPDEVPAHHQQDIEDTASGTHMAIPPLFSELQIKDHVSKNSICYPHDRREIEG